jgi:hypothetical protein
MFSHEFEQHMIDLQEDFLHSVNGFESEDLIDIATDFQSTFIGE